MSFTFCEGCINNDILHWEARPDFQIDKSSQARESKSTPTICILSEFVMLTGNHVRVKVDNISRTLN